MSRVPRALPVLLLACLAALPVGADTPAPPQGSPEQQKTITDIRSVGTAMFYWYRDQRKAHPVQEKARHAEAAHAANAANAAKAEPKSVDLAAIPVISREDLAKLLVPRYLQEIPAKDGWGNPYEFHLNTADLDAQSIMGLRSAGKDGRFSGDSYDIGAFPQADEGQDIAWVDGYFARWPQPSK